MTAKCRTEAGQLFAPAEGEEEVTRNSELDKGGCHPARRPEVSVGAGRSGGGKTAIDLEKAVPRGRCERDSGRKDFAAPTSTVPVAESRRIPSAAGRGAQSIVGFHAVVDACTAIDAGELGVRVQ